jgi:hypothetical protein
MSHQKSNFLKYLETRGPSFLTGRASTKFLPHETDFMRAVTETPKRSKGMYTWGTSEAMRPIIRREVEAERERQEKAALISGTEPKPFELWREERLVMSKLWRHVPEEEQKYWKQVSLASKIPEHKRSRSVVVSFFVSFSHSPAVRRVSRLHLRASHISSTPSLVTLFL